MEVNFLSLDRPIYHSGAEKNMGLKKDLVPRKILGLKKLLVQKNFRFFGGQMLGPK